MIQSIDRAMSIIHILRSDPHRNEWSISELSKRTELPISTMHRLLNSLIDHGLVIQNPNTKHYKIGLLWMEIGLQVLESIDYRNVARPIMEDLALDVKESIYLNIQDGNFGMTIELVDSPLKVRIAETLGIRSPLNVGAPNKAILSFLKEEERADIIKKLGLTDEETIQLKETIEEVRRNRYAMSNSERTEGTISIAAPIFGYGNKVLAAVSINGPDFRITEESLPQLVEKVKMAAEQISNRIGRFY